MEVLRPEKRTPLILITIEGTDRTEETALLYGHMDKQPPLTEAWDEDLGPWKPVLKGDRLYGRGGADDGYAIYASVLAIKCLQEQNVPHNRVVILIEACEESGSQDLPYYINSKSDVI